MNFLLTMWYNWIEHARGDFCVYINEGQICVAGHGRFSGTSRRRICSIEGKRQEISEKYLEAVLKVLVRERILVGLRGKGGGYKLGKPPEQYKVGTILRLTEGELAPVACLESHALPCSRAAQCRTLPMWEKFDQVVTEFFDGYTIADLMRSAHDENNDIT